MVENQSSCVRKVITILEYITLSTGLKSIPTVPTLTIGTCKFRVWNVYECVSQCRRKSLTNKALTPIGTRILYIYIYTSADTHTHHY